MKKRSPQYPQNNLLETRDFSVSVYEKAGDSTPLKYADLAKFGKVPTRDSDSYATTAKLYGWMVSVYGQGYTPVGSICTILRKPQVDEEKESYLTAFSKPEIYQKIISDYQGKSVAPEGLEIYLIRKHNFSDSGAKQCAMIFLQNANFLGLIDTDGLFNANGQVTITPIDEKQRKTKDVEATANAKPNSKKQKINNPLLNVKKLDEQLPLNPNSKTIMVFIKGQEFNWPVPNGMNSTDWDQLAKQIQQLKTYAT